MKKITIDAADGYPLSAIRKSALEQAKGTVIISSATGVKKEFYINFAEFLVEQGYNIMLFDYRGIGESAPADMRSSLIYMHEWGTKDMNAVLTYVTKTWGVHNIIWLGHSIGSQLVGFLENHQHIRKVISVSAALGYWRYFPQPMRAVVWMLWHIVSPLIVKVYGYGMMKRIGWGEDLPKNALLEWRKWCLCDTYYMSFIKEHFNTDRFYHFKSPIQAVYMSDDYIANDKTAPLMMKFFPNASTEVIKINAVQYTKEKVGHNGIFRKRFETSLWPVLMKLVSN